MSPSFFGLVRTAFVGQSPWAGLPIIEDTEQPPKPVKHRNEPGGSPVMHVRALDRQLPLARSKSVIGIRLRALIDKHAAMPDGFRADDATGDLLPRSAHKICNRMYKCGLLFKVQMPRSTAMHFFSHADLAYDFHVRQLAASKLKLAKLAKLARLAEQAKLAKLVKPA